MVVQFDFLMNQLVDSAMVLYFKKLILSSINLLMNQFESFRVDLYNVIVYTLTKEFNT